MNVVLFWYWYPRGSCSILLLFFGLGAVLSSSSLEKSLGNGPTYSSTESMVRSSVGGLSPGAFVITRAVR